MAMSHPETSARGRHFDGSVTIRAVAGDFAMLRQIRRRAEASLIPFRIERETTHASVWESVTESIWPRDSAILHVFKRYFYQSGASRPFT